MKIKDQLLPLKKLDLPSDEFIVVSSGSLAIHGIREAKDIDVIVTESLWDELSKKYQVGLNKWGIERLDLPNDIEILNPRQSIFGDSKVVPLNDLFLKAHVFEGVKFMNLNHLKEIKQALGRPVDLQDIELIDEYLKSNKHA